MEDLQIRELVAFGIIGALFVGGAISYAIHRRRAYWRKLRMAGDSEAKRRELRRR